MKRVALTTALVTLVLTACQDAPPTAPISAPPMASISDATSDGSPFFFWLPPLVDEPLTSGVPNPGLAPVLEICGVDVAFQCVEYTTTSGPGGVVINTNGRLVLSR